MAINNITFIEDLDKQKDDFTVKVRIARLWKQSVFKNPYEIYSIEMIFMDEQSTLKYKQLYYKNGFLSSSRKSAPNSDIQRFRVEHIEPVYRSAMSMEASSAALCGICRWLMAGNNIQKDNSTVKVRIVRLWKKSIFKNPDEIYSIEMILMDEQGTKIQANVLQKWIPKFTNLLQEGAAVFIKNPTIARYATKLMVGNNIAFIDDLDIQKDDFTVKVRIVRLWKQPVFKNPDEIYSIEMILMDEQAPKYKQMSYVIGEVIACETMVTLLDSNGKAKRRMQLKMQDLGGVKIQVTLWDAFAEELNNCVSTNKDKGIVVLVIQFAMVKTYREKPFLSNSFNGTRLFINSDIDEIKDFKKSLNQKSGESKLSQQISMLSGMSYSYHEDFLDRTNRANIVEISEIVEAKSLIVLGTVKAFRKDVPWFYMGCTRCNRKVRPTYIISDKDDDSGMKGERDSFDCMIDRCRGNQTEVLLKFRISLRVQDDTGIVSLTLFDREANKVLNQTATELYEKVKKSGDVDMFLDELDVLLDRRFAIKIDITDYNIKNRCFIYGISKLTDDDAILNDLEMRCASQQPAESESVNLHSTYFSSQDKLKDVVSYTGENATPSDADKSTTDNPDSEEKLCEKSLSKRVERKRLFESLYDADQEGKGSAI
ncbi:replication protein A 70 kDa DNA-binding subunit A-like [Cynara cardunculus var. scolymus]|uniref:replication protein A 70 kDa DNA-binding subunit A-like n=1 Tax=Cynara cardunculus var. scolymus TaxID=59895 RepID=UPI000D628C0E|nr:replication protein A 70 kDa DNA-binding subunit A-like [Cynara cardunculus var. scolymus]